MDAQGALGNGKFRLLESIEETGSLSAAADTFKISYRKAWGSLKKTEEYLGSVQVATKTYTKTYTMAKLSDPSNLGGDLDEFVLCNRTLSAAEIMELSFGGGIGPSALSEPQESPYEDWTEQEFAPEEMAASAVKLDADNDQLPNLLEYALVLDPQEANPTPIGQTQTVRGADEWVVEFTHDPSRTDVDIVLEWTESLNPVDWRMIAQSLVGGLMGGRLRLSMAGF